MNGDLKDRFRIFANEHDAASYGRLLAAALNSYTDGGRERRILDDVERLLTGSASTVEAPRRADESSTPAGEASGSTQGPDERPRPRVEGRVSTPEALSDTEKVDDRAREDSPAPV